MKTEARFLLAVLMMLGILVGTNRMFPPVVPEGTELLGDSVPVASAVADLPGLPTTTLPQTQDEPLVADEVSGSPPVVEVRVEGPRYRHTFSSQGARLVSSQLLEFEALNRDGPVELIPDGSGGYLGQKLVVGSDTIDLTNVPFRVEPSAGLRLNQGGSPKTLRFIYEHPTSEFRFEVGYTFNPDEYTIGVAGSVAGVDRALLLTDLGAGLAYAEADSALEARSMAYVYNHQADGVRSTLLTKADPEVVNGPLLWSAFRNKFFVMAMLAAESEAEVTPENLLGGILVGESPLEDRVRVLAAQSVASGDYGFRVFMGPQEYALLSTVGQGMEEVNPYGWKVFRPVLRPIVRQILKMFVFLHTSLDLGYGWVLVVFGVAMRIVLFPLNHKAMKAQLRNMAVQPLVKDVQDKHKENPEKLQKEMMKLYKEHGFNPLAGCLPMLLPWPVLIALFFVFQNTIELRGVPFLWLPDLSAKDLLYILPVVLAISMFLMQWVSLRSLEQENKQMKMMMYIMPPMMLFIFMNLASGLNLYYVTANIATLPQQIWIARERKKMQGQPPLTLSRE